jgi:hypothetical protein
MTSEELEIIKSRRVVSPRLFVAVMAHKYELGKCYNRKIDFLEGFSHFIDICYEKWMEQESGELIRQQLEQARSLGIDPLEYSKNYAQNFRSLTDDPQAQHIRLEYFEVTDPTGLHLRPLANIIHLTQASPNADFYMGRPLREKDDYDFCWNNTAFFQTRADSIFRTIEQLAVPKGTRMQVWAWGQTDQIEHFFMGLYQGLKIQKISS